MVHQASLSFTIFQSLLTFVFTESVVLSNHLILCRCLLLLPSIFPSIRIFSNESAIMNYNSLWSEVAQLCPTLCDPMDCSLPCSSIHGIFQGRILEWVAISFSRRASRPRDWTRVSHIVGKCFTVWATLNTSSARTPPLPCTFRQLSRLWQEPYDLRRNKWDIPI